MYYSVLDLENCNRMLEDQSDSQTKTISVLSTQNIRLDRDLHANMVRQNPTDDADETDDRANNVSSTKREDGTWPLAKTDTCFMMSS